MSFAWSQRLGIVDMLENYLLPMLPIDDKEKKRISTWWIHDNCETEPERLFRIFLTGVSFKQYAFLSLLNRCYRKEIPDEYFYYYSMFMNYFEKELMIMANDDDCGQFRFSVKHLRTGIYDHQEFINYKWLKGTAFTNHNHAI